MQIYIVMFLIIKHTTQNYQNHYQALETFVKAEIILVI